MSLTVYEKPSCTTCRNLAALLTERGIDFERVDFHVEPLAEEDIRELLRKANLSPHEALRRREPAAAAAAGLEAEELIARMAAEPALLQRPIVVNGERAVLARPVEKVLEIL